MNFDENWNSLKFTSITDENIMSAGGTVVNPSFSFGAFVSRVWFIHLL